MQIYTSLGNVPQVLTEIQNLTQLPIAECQNLLSRTQLAYAYITNHPELALLAQNKSLDPNGDKFRSLAIYKYPNLAVIVWLDLSKLN